MKRDLPLTQRQQNPRGNYEVDVRTYEEGDWVLRQGDTNRTFYVILSGEVRIIQGERVVRVLGEQDVFGLESLLLRTPSPVGAKALNSCRISSYSYEALDYFLDQQPRMTRSLVTSLLRQLGRTSTHLAEQVEDFSLDPVEVRFFSDGETIIEQGTSGTEFYRLVSSGSGLVVTKDRVEIGHISQPGEFFGEMAVLLRTPRHATIRSRGESAVQVFDADALHIIIRDYPELATKLIQSLAARLASVSNQLTESGPPY